MLGVAVHWSVHAEPADHGGCVAVYRNIVASHTAQGYRYGIAYNWVVCPHGEIMGGRTWADFSGANGTTWANLNYWAVCAISGPGYSGTDAQRATLARLIDEAPKDSRDVQPHSAFYATQCCGDPYRAWIAAGAQAPSTGGPPKEQDMYVVKNRDNGSHTLYTAQGATPNIAESLSNELVFAGVPRYEVPGNVAGDLALIHLGHRNDLVGAIVEAIPPAGGGGFPSSGTWTAG